MYLIASIDYVHDKQNNEVQSYKIKSTCFPFGILNLQRIPTNATSCL